MNIGRFCYSVEILDREALGVSNIVRNIIMFFPATVVLTLPQDVMRMAFEQITRITCFFSEGAAQEESVSLF